MNVKILILFVTHLKSASTQKEASFALLTATPRSATYSPVEIVQVITNTEHFCYCLITFLL